MLRLSLGICALVAAAGCTGAGADRAATVTASSTTAGQTGTTPPTAEAEITTGAAPTFLDPATVHDLTLSFDEQPYRDMLAAYAASGDKNWIEVTVSVDGKSYPRAGARLKGNSSLRGLSRDASTPPQSLPWLIRLDKYVDGQSHDGITELVVRANSTETALNEAVALDLLRTAGLASEQAALARLTVNGSPADLRLVIENPNDAWVDANFDGDGLLYKAESTGDYSYRGDDPDAYDEVFDQETGSEANLAPLVEFLQFINESDDAAFASGLAQRLDVDAFATYLAFENLIDNFDDIDGPGNNAYLYWDQSTDQFTVVAWDHNLAFGARPGGPGGPAGPGGPGGPGGPSGPGGPGFPGGPSGPGDPPPGMQPPDRPPTGDAPAGGQFGPGGPPGRANILVQRFMAVPDFAAKVDAATAELDASLYAGGAATASLDRWSTVITSQADDLVDAAMVAADAAVITRYVS